MKHGGTLFFFEASLCIAPFTNNALQSALPIDIKETRDNIKIPTNRILKDFNEIKDTNWLKYTQTY